MSWSKCNDASVLSPDDFQTSDSEKIIDLQIKDLEVTINSEKYQIEPELGFEFGNFNQLSYELYGFRREFPALPDYNQLKETLLNGDDSRFNILVLLIDSRFQLFSPREVGDFKNPGIVLQHEGFCPGNEYVGRKLLEIKDLDAYLEEYYRDSIFYWKGHLLKRKIHYFSDSLKGKNTDALLDLISEIKKIEKDWELYAVK